MANSNRSYRSSQLITPFGPGSVIEIGDEYQEIFELHGGEKIQLVPSCNDHTRFIDGLEQLIRDRC